MQIVSRPLPILVPRRPRREILDLFLVFLNHLDVLLLLHLEHLAKSWLQRLSTCLVTKRTPAGYPKLPSSCVSYAEMKFPADRTMPSVLSYNVLPPSIYVLLSYLHNRQMWRSTSAGPTQTSRHH